LYKNYYF